MYVLGEQINEFHVGIDWISATFKRIVISGEDEAWAAQACKSMFMQATSGMLVEPERDEILGYRGWRRDGLFVGHRHDGVLVQARSSIANGVFPLLDASAHCTRIDLHATGNFEKYAQPERTLYPIVKQSKGVPGVFYVEPELHMDDADGDKLEIGARSSDRYIRVYDKTKEKKDARYEEGNWHRFEVELKGELADKAFDLLQTERGRSQTLVSLIQHESTRRGLPVSFYDTNPITAMKVDRSDIDRTVESQMRWLGKQVRPTVRRLLREGVTAERIQEQLGFWSDV